VARVIHQSCPKPRHHARPGYLSIRTQPITPPDALIGRRRVAAHVALRATSYALGGERRRSPPNGTFAGRPHIWFAGTVFEQTATLPKPSRAAPLELTADRRSLDMEATRARSRENQVDYDDDALDRLADLLAERLAARLGLLTPAQREPLVDAAEIARLHGKTRSWVYEHAGELGAIRLGSGPGPRLGFSPGRVAAFLEKVNDPLPAPRPETPQPGRRRQRPNRTAAGAPLLHVRPKEASASSRSTVVPRDGLAAEERRSPPGSGDPRICRQIASLARRISHPTPVNAPSLRTGPEPRDPIRKPMGRPATGQVVKPTERQPTFGLRFTAYGKREYLTLGRPEDGWTMAMAQRELAVVLREVDLGIWRPPRKDPAPAADVDPTFHEFAPDWFAAKRLEVEENTANHYRDDLTNHLLPFFKDHHRPRSRWPRSTGTASRRCAKRPRSRPPRRTGRR
jgi:Phage integrase, N-terminal SAM-like domain